MNRESILPESSCPNCNRKMDRATGIRDRDDVPEPGSISICICCAAINEYDDDLRLRLLPEDELKEISIQHPKTYQILMKAQRIVKQKIKE